MSMVVVESLRLGGAAPVQRESHAAVDTSVHAPVGAPTTAVSRGAPYMWRGKGGCSHSNNDPLFDRVCYILVGPPFVGDGCFQLPRSSRMISFPSNTHHPTAHTRADTNERTRIIIPRATAPEHTREDTVECHRLSSTASSPPPPDSFPPNQTAE